MKLVLLNTGLLTAALYFSGFIIMYPRHRTGVKRMLDFSWYDARERLLSIMCMLAFYLVLGYSFFLPIRTGNFLNYAGFALYGAAFVALLLAYRDYLSAPLNKPITAGVYRISRNPLYFFTTCGLAGCAMVAASPLMAGMLLVYVVFQHLVILAEEKHCLNVYGTEFEAYLQRAPRYFLFF